MSLKLTCILLCEVAADPVWKVVLVATIEGRLWSSLEPIFFFFRVAVFPLIFLAFTWYFNNNSTIFKFPTQHAKYRTVWPLTSLKFMSNGTSNSLDPEIQKFQMNYFKNNYFVHWIFSQHRHHCTPIRKVIKYAKNLGENE